MLLDLLMLVYALVTFFLRFVWHIFRLVGLWLSYNSKYMEIRKNPRLLYRMRDDPGVRFMQAGWRIVWLIIMAIYAYGAVG
jgi:hypothetical protein